MEEVVRPVKVRQATKRDKQVATYLDDELYAFFLERIVPRYGLSASDAIKLLLVQEKRRLEDNNTKEHALEILQHDTEQIKGDTAAMRAEIEALELTVKMMRRNLDRVLAQNELLLIGVMGAIIHNNGEPIIVSKEIVRQVRELVNVGASEEA